MARYVDGFVVPVPRARLASKVWLDHGALEYVECVEDDVEYGKSTSFPRSVKRKDDEVVVFAWIAYTSRAQRDKVLKLAMNDPRFSSMDPKNMPFDAKRMFWGGFKTLVDKQAE